MTLDKISQEIDAISQLINIGDFEEAYSRTDILLNIVENSKIEVDAYYILMSNIAGFFVDIGHMQKNTNAAKRGLEIFEEKHDEIIKRIGESNFYYNLANAKTNLIEEKNPFKHSFETIEKLIEIKSYFWKALKSLQEDDKDKPLELMVNIGNSLKQQFRIVEALNYYDKVNSYKKDIPQAWINRSETLIMLNTVSNSYSIKMLEEIKKGYVNILNSSQLPPQWLDYYNEQINIHSSKIDEIRVDEGIKPDLHDDEETLKEYQRLSKFRKFCLNKNLTLSEHGLYCQCAASARDNLVIPTLSGIKGDFIIPMEMVLNRVKSEFSFSRRLYYEYLSGDTENELKHESCFSELFNDELLGIDVEKLRTAFRLCFGILDKIGVAICELYDLYPPNNNVSFQSFWQLSHHNRRGKFESVKTPGLLALYSIATDLNDKKDGEWEFYKQWRNDLEHKFVVIHTSDNPSDVYSSYSVMKKIIFIKESDFVQHLEQLLQLTRSAIFSFVFAVREYAARDQNDGDTVNVSNVIHSQNY